MNGEGEGQKQPSRVPRSSSRLLKPSGVIDNAIRTSGEGSWAGDDIRRVNQNPTSLPRAKGTQQADQTKPKWIEMPFENEVQLTLPLSCRVRPSMVKATWEGGSMWVVVRLLRA